MKHSVNHSIQHTNPYNIISRALLRTIKYRKVENFNLNMN